MGISTALSRFSAYYTRHGFVGTIRRAALAARRALFSNRMVLFYCDMAKQTTAPANIPNSLKVERLRCYAELNPQDLNDILNFWNPKLAQRNMKERFGNGASLWLIKSEGKLAGYGWTLRGRTIEPHYFPPGQDDVHLFDFHVFPQYRRRGMNPFLVTHILRSLVSEGAVRALIEAAEWNQAQLSSLSRTPFRRLGRARKLTMLGRTIVCWAGDETATRGTKVPVRPIDNPATGK